MKQITKLVIALCVLTSCSREWQDNQQSDYRTVLAYIAADNDLNKEARDKCDALLEGWHPQDGGLLAVADNGSQPVLMKASGNNGKKQWDTLRVYEHTDMADAALLRRVVEEMPTIAPAKCYGLIVFSHATGWLPKGAFAHPDSYAPPIGSRTLITAGSKEMSIDDFAAALPDRGFCFIVFDMCFMANTEALYALRNKTHAFAVSTAEILSPGFTPAYRTSLSRLYTPHPDLVGFAQDFFNYWNSQEGIYRSATVSVVKSNGLEELATWAKQQHAAEKIAASSDSLLKATQTYDRLPVHLFHDLYDVLGSCVHTEAERQQLNDIFSRTVILSKTTGRIVQLPIMRHSGLSTYIPRSTLPALNMAHEQTAWQHAIK